MDKQTLAALAKDVLENDAFITATEDVLSDLFARFMASATEDEKNRETLWATGQALSILTARLKFYVEDAKLDKE